MTSHVRLLGPPGWASYISLQPKPFLPPFLYSKGSIYTESFFIGFLAVFSFSLLSIYLSKSPHLSTLKHFLLRQCDL